jgi:hypothetical protein
MRLGFAERIKGSHHIFTREGVEEILNLQPCQSWAKPYQAKQVRTILFGIDWSKGPNDQIRDHSLLERRR